MNRWVLEMREYKYHINYINGTKNVVADTLSRPIILIEANNEGTWLGKNREEIRDLQRRGKMEGPYRLYRGWTGPKQNL